MSSPTVYLVSGANRGIGLGLVSLLVRRENTVVFAGARTPETAKDLHTLSEKFLGKLHIVQLISGDKVGNEAAVEQIKKLSGKLDVVIANAGINQFHGPVLETPVAQMYKHFEVNVVGALVLFQAVYPLLRTSTQTPKFIIVSSGAGSIEDGSTMPFGMLPYGASKAAENFLARKIHVEHPDLVCFPINPGGVATDMAEFAFEQNEKMRGIPLITVEDSAAGIITQIDNGTRENASGQFVDYTGSRWKW